MIIAFTICLTPIALAIETVSRCYQVRAVEYEDYLDRNFDGSNTSTSPLDQIYLTSKANNETYTLKEMLLGTGQARVFE